MSEKLLDCPLTDAELVEACLAEVSRLCKGEHWRMHIPVDLRRDSDILFAELAKRFQDRIAAPAKTFFCIKRSDALHYFYFRDYGYGFDWTDDIREAILYDEKPIIEGMAPAALKTLTSNPTARIVKVVVSEVGG